VSGAADGSGVELLLIGGRSGVGKTSVAFEVSAQLAATGVAHCLVDGDNLCHAQPKPDTDPQGTALTQANLRSVWANYAAAGYHRVIYVNTVSVLEDEIAWIAAAVGAARVTAILLTAADATVGERLGARERGSELEVHLTRSAAAARRLDDLVGVSVHRVGTDDTGIADVARAVVSLTDWGTST
jgi:predicted kinase